MEKNELRTDGITCYRILEVMSDQVLVIDCRKKTMPVFVSVSEMEGLPIISEDEIGLYTDEIAVKDIKDLTPTERKIALNRYTVIATPLSVIEKPKKRNLMIQRAAEQFGISRQTVRNYFCQYLVYQSIAALVTPKKEEKTELTADQKNMRWALNKFFYTQHENSLQTAFTMMLKERYCDSKGDLKKEHPSFYQFRYFYRKTRKLENFYISRKGLTDYQRNHRPLLGDGVQEYAIPGTAMLDGTICDIYLVNEIGELLGRPVLVVAVDANTSLCLGYALLWEGGIYSLQQLMLSIITDKVGICRKMGIAIKKDQWPVDRLPAVMITDQGSEYTGETFEQIAELGVTLINLPSYRPELKGTVEKFFDLVQDSYKDALKGRGVIMPDFQSRGAHDYREDACLTLAEFERIVVRCIVYYNSERILENYPYTEKMLEAGVKPYAADIWNWKMNHEGATLIHASEKDIRMILLHRTEGKFTRYGLKVNGLRYHADGYKEAYLQGNTATVAYDPENVSKVWLKKSDGTFVEFTLIESRYKGLSVSEVEEIRQKQKNLIKDTTEEQYRARIELLRFIEDAAETKRQKDKMTEGDRK